MISVPGQIHHQKIGFPSPGRARSSFSRTNLSRIALMEGVLDMDKSFITSLDNSYACSSNAAAGKTVQDVGKQFYTPNVAAFQNADDSCICAICLDTIQPEETAQIKGCGHNYCVSCILRWASYVDNPWCPQCKHRFSSLYVYRAIDGSMHDYMVEESICLLLRAPWFELFPPQEAYDEQDDYPYEDEIDEEYYGTSNIRLGNRRWGDSGYVRAGRKEARPVGARGHGTNHEAGGSSARASKGKEVSKEAVGRRALRAQKREAADKAAAAKHQKHLQKLGRKAF